MTNLINKRLLAMIMAGTLSLPAVVVASGTGVPAQATSAVASRTVKGRVVDDTGEPLPGATVMVKGTQIGTGTDIDGNFTVELKDHRKVTIVVSYVGMERKEIQAAPGDDLYIALSPNGNVLDELIVSGYQTISRERATGSAIVLGSEKLDKIQAPDLSAKLEGIAPGLTVYNNSMSIRGASSFAVDATPLLVIDGQPATGLTMADINPNIIEGVTVLKDAAATSLYGVRAANGVIVITTKRGRDSKLDVTASLGYYINPLPSLDYQHYASTGDILDFERDFLLSDPDYINNPAGYFSTMTSKSNAKQMSGIDMLYYRLANGEITQEQLDASVASMKLNDYRRQYRDQLQQTALTQDYNLSLNKGGDTYGFYAAARYQKMGLYNKYDSDDRFSLYLKNDLQIAKWMSLTLGADLSFMKTSYSQASGLGATAAMPYDLLYNPDGSLVYRYLYNEVLAEQVNNTEGLNFMGYNAAEEAYRNKLKTDNLYMKYFIQTNFDITRDLGLEIKFQYEKRKLDASEYDEADSYMMRSLVNEFASVDSRGNLTYNIPQGGRMYTVDTDYDYYNLRAQFDYKKTFGEKHDVTALIGGELRQDLTKSHAGERFGYDDKKLTYGQVDWKTLSQSGVVGSLYSTSRMRSENLSISEIKHRYVSAYLNAGYIYDSRYSLNASVRVEQADLFGSDPKYRYRPLWSVGASWNVSNESFMKDFSWLNMLKVRCTYGITGNVDQSSSPYLLASFGSSYYSGAPITLITSPPNSSLRWEKTSTFNFGVDFRIFNRFSGSIDAYRKYSSDLLVNKSIDPSLGFDGQARANNGEMKNVGFEVNLSYEFVRTRDIIFNASFSTAYNSNKIMKIDYDPTDALDMMRDPASNYRVGDTFNSLYAYRYAGLTENGIPSIYDENGNVVSVSSVRNIGAVVCAGQLIPKWNGALNLDFRWRDLSVYAKLVYYAGHTLRRDVPTLYDSANRITGGNVNEMIADRWTPENTDTDIPAMGLHGDTGESNYHWIYADYNTCSASFVKLRNIGVSYSMPSRLLSKTRVFKGVTLRFQIDNLFRITSNKWGIDPEAFNANLGTRTDVQLPSYNTQTPTYTIGLNINL